MLKFFSRKSNPKKELKKLVGDYRLPIFPAVALKAMQALRDDKQSMSDIAKIIVNDPGLSVAMLKTVNSASFALRQEIRNVPHAVTLLGRSQVEGLLVSSAVRSSLPRKSPSIDMDKFWRLASRRASIARGLAQVLHPSSSMTCYTASLLQDMAVPVLAEAKSDYAPVLMEWLQNGGDLHGLEHSRFGWTHAEIGGWLCQTWEFPDSLTGPIVTHHYGEDEEASEMAPPAVLLVAALGAAPNATEVEELVERARARYNMCPDSCTEIVEKGISDGDETAQLFR